MYALSGLICGVALLLLIGPFGQGRQGGQPIVTQIGVRKQAPYNLQKIAPLNPSVAREAAPSTASEAELSEVGTPTVEASIDPGRVIVTVLDEIQYQPLPNLEIQLSAQLGTSGPVFTDEGLTTVVGEFDAEIPDRKATIYINVKDPVGGGILHSWSGPYKEDVEIFLPPKLPLNFILKGSAELVLEREGSIYYRVDGVDIAGQRYRYLGSAQFNALGQATLLTYPAVQDSEVDVTLSIGGQTIGRYRVLLKDALRSGGAEININLQEVRLSVASSDGKAIGVTKCKVSSLNDPNALPGRVLLDSNGDGTAIVANGRAELCIGAAGFQPHHHAFSVPSSPLSIKLEPVNLADQFTCEVRDHLGEPLEKVLVSIAPDLGESGLGVAAMTQGSTDEDGRANLLFSEGVPYYVYTHHPEYGTSEGMRVSPVRDCKVVLTMDQSFSVAVRFLVDGAEKVGGTGFHWLAENLTFHRSSGGFLSSRRKVIPSLPLGDYALYFYGHDEALWGVATVEALPGVDYKVDVDLRSGLTVDGSMMPSAKHTYARVTAFFPQMPEEVSRKWSSGSIRDDGSFRLFIPFHSDIALEFSTVGGMKSRVSGLELGELVGVDVDSGSW